MPAIDLAFPVYGQTIRAEHSYALYHALAVVVPGLLDTRNRRWNQAGILPITGRRLDERWIALVESSRFILRIDCKLVKHVLPLAGARLLLRNDAVQLGKPVGRPLTPASHLVSQLVVFKGTAEPERFLRAVEAAVRSLRIKGVHLLPRQYARASAATGPLASLQTSAPRHSIVVPCRRRGRTIGFGERIGFGVEIQELSAAESLRVQESGIGGYRKFGCGIFVAARH